MRPDLGDNAGNIFQFWNIFYHHLNSVLLLFPSKRLRERHRNFKFNVSIYQFTTERLYSGILLRFYRTSKNVCLTCWNCSSSAFNSNLGVWLPSISNRADENRGEIENRVRNKNPFFFFTRSFSRTRDSEQRIIELGLKSFRGRADEIILI